MKKKFKLPDVTLLAVTSTEMDDAQISMKIFFAHIEFAKSRLLCSSLQK